MSSKTQIYIVEDMAFNRVSLEADLTTMGYGIAGSSARAETAHEEILEHGCDLVLLDINLAGQKNGIWLAKKLRQNYRVPIVYLTAFGDIKTIDEVIATNPEGYLMKPYDKSTLLATIRIALSKFESNKEEPSNEESVLFIKDGYSKIKLAIDSISHVHSEANYIKIFHNDKTHLIRHKLSDFMELLPKKSFIQTHKRYIINQSMVTAILKDHLLIGNIRIPISKSFRKKVHEKFD